MPCFSGDENCRTQYVEVENKELTALVCGLISTHGLTGLKWKEMGISREWAENWWKKHQAKDAARKAQEVEKKQKELLKQQALSKLTDREKIALGIKTK